MKRIHFELNLEIESNSLEYVLGLVSNVITHAQGLGFDVERGSFYFYNAEGHIVQDITPEVQLPFGLDL